jgi:phosphoglycerate dehydrogenase-like enzyme
MKKFRIFVDFNAPDDAIQLLRDETAGHELLFAEEPAISVLAKGNFDPQLAAADIAFGQPDAHGIQHAKNLEWVQISSSGITRYDNAEFRAFVAAKKIQVTNSADVYAEPCAVHALSFILAHERRIPGSLRSCIIHGSTEWNSLRHSCGTLRGQTVLIVGFGAIGKRLAELLRPFAVNVIAYRRKPRGDEGVPVVSENQLAQALAGADHVVNILPDSAETKHFFNAARFSQIKRGAVFYNIGRGATVDQNALLDALRSEKIEAAWLDVTDPEPLPENHPLWNQTNCFITPHTAGGHPDETKTLVRHFAGNLRRFIEGKPLVNRVM